ncbi:hypothetical protein [Vibrio phage VP41s3]|nr:hypothetical protein [Vibrio phage VP41s3]
MNKHTLSPEELASGDWVWDADKEDFVNINEPEPESEKEEEEEEIVELPTHAVEGMKWNGYKLS